MPRMVWPLGLYRKAVDGSGPEELLLTVDGSNNLVATDWSLDGRYIIYHQSRPSGLRIFALPLFGDRTPIDLAGPQFGPYGARLSPDGRWLAYVSFESGPPKSTFSAFSSPARSSGFSNGGGTHPRWTNDGRELVYRVVLGGIDAVDFNSDGTNFRIGPRRPLVQAPVLTLIDGRNEVRRHARRPAAHRAEPAGPQGPGIGVILNWTERLKQ